MSSSNKFKWNEYLDGTPNWGADWSPLTAEEAALYASGKYKAGSGTTDSSGTTSGTSSTGTSSSTSSSGYTAASKLAEYENGRPTYTQSPEVTEAWGKLQSLEGAKPSDYTSKYGDQIQSILDQILNRDPFKYDFNADPMYQMYKDRYLQQGKMAMQDTMGEAAALSGGYGNSYATTAGQQAYQSYLQGLNDTIPDLRDFAYNAWLNEGDTLRSNLSTLQGLDDTDYNRYRDTVGDYKDELNYYYTKFGDMSDREYNRYLNDAAAWESDRDYWYNKALYEQELAQAAAAAAAATGSSSSGSSSGSKSTSSSNSNSVLDKDNLVSKNTANSEDKVAIVRDNSNYSPLTDDARTREQQSELMLYNDANTKETQAWSNIEKIANTKGKYAAKDAYEDYVAAGTIKDTDANYSKLLRIGRDGR